MKSRPTRKRRAQNRRVCPATNQQAGSARVIISTTRGNLIQVCLMIFMHSGVRVAAAARNHANSLESSPLKGRSGPPRPRPPMSKVRYFEKSKEFACVPDFVMQSSLELTRRTRQHQRLDAYHADPARQPSNRLTTETMAAWCASIVSLGLLTSFRHLLRERQP
jgi:hypothetical protein